MARQTINVGTNQDDGTGDTLRAAFVKVNANFVEIYNELGGDTPSNLKLTGNTITTDTTNTNIILDPNGTGKVELVGDVLNRGNLVSTGQLRGATLQVDGNANIDGGLVVDGAATFGAITIGSTIASDLNVSGAVTVGGTFTANGNIDLGDTSADTITVVGRFDSSLVPGTTLTYDIGSSSLRWRDVYARDLDARNATLSGTTDITGNTTIGGNLTISGNITIGDSDSDIINIEADLGGNLIPDADGTYSIGTDAKRYLNVYTDVLNVTDKADIDLISIENSTITTTTTNTNITIDPQGTGIAIVDGQLRVTGTFQVSSGQTVDMGSNRVQSVATPSSGTDATNKTYVDTQVATKMTNFTIAGDDSSAQTVTNGYFIDFNGEGIVTTSVVSNQVKISATPSINSLTDVNTVDYAGAPSRSAQPLVWDNIDSVWYPGNGLSLTGILTMESGGIIYVKETGYIMFEGTTANDYETKLEVVNPTQDNTVKLPNKTGTLITELADDLSPQLGGDLDVSGFNIVSAISNQDINIVPSGTGKVSFATDRIHVESYYTPLSAVGSAGDERGDIAWDVNYLYVCTANYDGATSIWKRTAISTW